MGHPKFQRRKYRTPLHPWQEVRIDEERDLLVDYGLKNKKEVWRANSLLRKFKTQVKRLIREETEQARKEEKQFLERLSKLNLLPKTAKLEDVLALTVNDILDRRLQTQVVKQKLAKTIHQARQFITHGHILVNNKKVNVPSFMVLLNDTISFSPKSLLSKSDHPERFQPKLEVKTQLRLPKKKEEKKDKKKEKPKTKTKKVVKKTKTKKK